MQRNGEFTNISPCMVSYPHDVYIRVNFENNFEFSQIEKWDLEALKMKLFVCFVVFFLANV
jgi:hypothetical protein